jgi:hypothetical protein
MLFFSQDAPSKTIPQYALKAEKRASDEATLLTLISSKPIPNICNDGVTSSWTAIVMKRSRPALIEMAASSPFAGAKRSEEHLNHKWLIVERGDTTLMYSDTSDYGLDCHMDMGFHADKIFSLDGNPPFFSEKECQLILVKYGLTFDALRKMPGATLQKIDIIVQHRFKIDAAVNKHPNVPAKEFFKSLLSSSDEKAIYINFEKPKQAAKSKL